MAVPGQPPVGFPVARGGPAERETAPCGDFVEGIALCAMLALGQLGAQKQTAGACGAGRLHEQVKLVAGTGNHRQFRITVST